MSGNDLQRVRRVASQILAGRVAINGMLDDPQAPWGGFKLSGVGREFGAFGIEAFLAAQQRGNPFSLVITDLGMPYVDGRKVAAAVKAAAPSVGVIMLTGWGRRLLAENDIPPFVDRVLSKPPKLADLRVALAELAAKAGQPDIHQEVS